MEPEPPESIKKTANLSYYHSILAKTHFNNFIPGNTYGGDQEKLSRINITKYEIMPTRNLPMLPKEGMGKRKDDYATCKYVVLKIVDAFLKGLNASIGIPR